MIFHDGVASVQVGDLVEIRGAENFRVIRDVDGEWGNRFSGRHVARVRTVTHDTEGSHVKTTLGLTSPLRSMKNPLTAIVKSQPTGGELFQLRLDDDLVGLDSGVHVD